MTITILCPTCRQPAAAPAEAAGQIVQCPHCGHEMLLPGTAAPEPQTPPPATTGPPGQPQSLSALPDEMADAGAPLEASSGNSLGIGRRGQWLPSLAGSGAGTATASGAWHLVRNYSLAVVIGLLGVVILVTSGTVIASQAGTVTGHFVPLFVGKIIGAFGIAIAVHGVILRRQSPKSAEGNLVEVYAGQAVAYALLLFYLFGAFLIGARIMRTLEGWNRSEALTSALICFVVIGGGLLCFAEVAKRFGFFRSAAWTYLALFGATPIVMLVLTIPISQTVAAVLLRAMGHVSPVRVVKVPPIGEPSDVPLPDFPLTLNYREIESGIFAADVKLDIPRDQPGEANRLRILKPGLAHPAKSLPCVLIAPGGSEEYAGMKMAGVDENEQLQYARAGFLVVAYNVDGPLPTSGKTEPTELQSAYAKFRAARAGLINARNALEFLLETLPEADPNRIYAAGWDSAGTLALLLAAHDRRIQGCAVYAPHLEKGTLRKEHEYERALGRGSAEFLQDHSPDKYTSRFRCPVFIYHHRKEDKTVRPVDKSMAFAERLRRCDVAVDTVFDGEGTAQDGLVERGFPAGIAWLVERSGLGAGLEIADAPQEPPQVATVPPAIAEPPGGSVPPPGGPVAVNPAGQERLPHLPPLPPISPVAPGNPLVPGNPVVSINPNPPRVPAPDVALPLRSLTAGELAKGRRDFARQLLIDTAVGSDDRVLRQLRWHPGARRPSIGLRWGLGVYMVGESRQPSVTTLTELQDAAGQLGTEIANRLQERTDAGRFGEWPLAEDRRLNKLTLLGSDTLSKLGEKAASNAVDAYAVISVTRRKAPLARDFQIRMLVRVLNVRKEVEPWSSSTLSSTQLKAAGSGAADIAEKWLQEIMGKIDELYGLQPMPSYSVAKTRIRAEELAQSNAPLAERVAELRYYHAKEQLTDADAAAALDQMLGAGKGSRFLAGDEALRRKLLAAAEP